MVSFFALMFIYTIPGILMYLSDRDRSKGERWLVIFWWPYVVYMPEGRDWYDKLGG
jgi:hypothetical protein